MSLPVIETIAKHIICRLENIQLKNGYAFNVAAVELLTRDADTYTPVPLSIVVDLVDETENEAHSCPGNPPAVAYDAQFMVHGYSRQLDRDDDLSNVHYGVTRHQMQAAIQKAVTTPVAGDWVTWESNALTSSMTSKTKFEAPGHDGVTFSLLVTYRTDEDDPTVKR